MRAASIGVRTHTGWAAIVVVSLGDVTDEPKILARRTLSLTIREQFGADQPYHHAATLPLKDCEPFLHQCAETAKALASAGFAAISSNLEKQGFDLAGVAVLRSSLSEMPALASILASHPLIHSAEGAFFRQAIIDGGEALGLPVVPYSERALVQRSVSKEREGDHALLEGLAAAGRSIGPPWTKDQKLSSLAAAILLREGPTTGLVRPTSREAIQHDAVVGA